MLEDQEALKRAADSAKPEVILHLAAQAGVRYGLENPKAYIDSNLTGSWNVLELARQVKPSISFLPRRARFMERMKRFPSKKPTAPINL
jgi:nucleoside-diphosphate-sugar epimerase